MRPGATLLTIVVALGVGLAGPATASPRIIDGEFAKTNPGAVALDRNPSASTAFCTGSVIAPTWVLSAAHCVGSANQTYYIRAGALDIRQPGGEIGKVVSNVKAPKGDLALLKLEQPLTTPPVKLADAAPAIGASVDITGWGQCGPGCVRDGRLKAAKATVSSYEGTDYVGGPAVRTEYGTGRVGSGDSGGPMFFNGEQIGVCSTAEGKSMWHGDVVKHRDWIRSVAGV